MLGVLEPEANSGFGVITVAASVEKASWMQGRSLDSKNIPEHLGDAGVTVLMTSRQVIMHLRLTHHSRTNNPSPKLHCH